MIKLLFNKKRLATALAVTMVLILAACSSAASQKNSPAADGMNGNPMYQEGEMAQAYVQETASTEAAATGANPEQGLVEVAPVDTVRKVITDVDASLLVENVQETATKLRQAAEAMGGYVNSSELSESAYGYRANLSLRVPSAKVESFSNSLADYGKVTHTSSSSSDVTDSYYDIQARLKNAQNQEKKLTEIMGQANTVEDLLRVREELDKVQERIEQFQGKLNMWDQLTTLSRINIEITQESKFVLPEDESAKTLSGGELWKGIKDGFNRSISGVANFFTGLIIGLSYILVPVLMLALVLFLIFLLVRALMKKSAKRRAKKVQTQTPVTEIKNEDSFQ